MGPGNAPGSLVTQIGTLEGADLVVRGRILQALEVAERDPARTPELLARVAGAACLCQRLVPRGEAAGDR